MPTQGSELHPIPEYVTDDDGRLLTRIHLDSYVTVFTFRFTEQKCEKCAIGLEKNPAEYLSIRAFIYSFHPIRVHQLTSFRWYLHLKLVRRFANAIALMVTPAVA